MTSATETNRMLKLLSRTKILAFADIEQRRRAHSDELGWEHVSGVFTMAAGFAVAVLTVLTLVG